MRESFAVTVISMVLVYGLGEATSICKDHEGARVCLEGTVLTSVTTQEVLLPLSEFGITDIVPGAFDHDESIDTLMLSHNSLTTIRKEMFRGLSNVTFLSFFNNSIENIEDGTFDALTNLEELDLSYNRLNTLGTGIRNGLKELKKLQLNYNGYVLTENGFEGLAKLELLELGGNKIVDIQPGTFNGLGKLTQLDLYGNVLSVLQSDTFRGLGDLQELDLGENVISTMQKHVFRGLGKLNSLWLNGNQITILEPQDVFQDVPNLRTLYLNHNPFRTVDLAAFNGPRNVTIEPGFKLNDKIIKISHSITSGHTKLSCVPGEYYIPYVCTVLYEVTGL